MEFQSEFDREGLTFFVRGWAPSSKPRAVAALVHGLGEHTGRYTHVGSAVADAGIALMGFDLRGHGNSGGKRGDSPSFEALMEDIDEFLRQAEVRYPGLPLFLYGHSMGGNLVLNYALRRNPRLLGVVATSPWLNLAFEPSGIRLAFGRVIRRLLPSLSQSNSLDSGSLSRDPEVVAAASADPLNHGKITVRLYFAVHEAGLWALDHASDFPLPLLLLHGTADRITSFEASREFAERAGTQVTFRAWEGYYHETHNELGREEVIRTITDWMIARLRGAHPAGKRSSGRAR